MTNCNNHCNKYSTMHYMYESAERLQDIHYLMKHIKREDLAEQANSLLNSIFEIIEKQQEKNII